MKKRFYNSLLKIWLKLPLPKNFKDEFILSVRRIWPQKEEAVALQDHAEDEAVNRYVQQILSIPYKSNDYVELAADHYQRQAGDPMLLAYYLPQFHPTPENDAWWGRGVTEWHNVSRAVPQYPGHYQPRLPGELGYYDLRLTENIARQIELARTHGIYGFAYYYYWFDGQRLLDKPLDAFLGDASLDFPFCLCWANESWTRRFDGNSSEIIMRQNESVESYQAFIESVRPYLADRRYIRIQGRPVLIVYRPSLVPDSREVLAYWRSFCQQAGLGNPYIIGVRENTFDRDLLSLGYDAQSEFHPGSIFRYSKEITDQFHFMDDNFRGTIFDYADLVKNKRYLKSSGRKLYRAIMPMWDNTPRRINRPVIYEGASPALYKEWLKDILQETRENRDLDAPFVFVNAWNEWGESTYLEPDRRYGYAYLRATREAIEKTRTPRIDTDKTI
jgi:hypothetical protein